LQGEPVITGALLACMQDQQKLRDMLSPQQSAAIGVLFETVHGLDDRDWSILFS
jgi:hypothetical protein